MARIFCPEINEQEIMSAVHGDESVRNPGVGVRQVNSTCSRPGAGPTVGPEPRGEENADIRRTEYQVKTESDSNGTYLQHPGD
jgi:hypothetical protein